MRKIFPPSFKFAILILYGLLLITPITLADLLDQCGLKKVNSPKTKQVTVGYVQIFPKEPNPIDIKLIPWDSYDFINVIAYPKGGGGGNIFNDIYRPGNKDDLNPIKDLVKDRNNKKPGTKILLSIRNYDPKDWPQSPVSVVGSGIPPEVPKDGKDPKDEPKNYNDIIEDTIKTINEFTLDGVDIEYPGMRGIFCYDGDSQIWNQATGDPVFVQFISDLRKQLNTTEGKTLMLTVGSEMISVPDGLNDNIDYLNIETYHFSLYENSRNPPQDPKVVQSYPNAPLDKFKDAFNNWSNHGKIDKKKAIMGVDFGNTFQVVQGKIDETQSVIFTPPEPPENFRNDQIIKDLKRIDDICGDQGSKLYLYSFPWNKLSVSILDQSKCGGTITTTPKWNNKFDPVSSTSWLYREAPESPQAFNHYISYEDVKSLSKKLEFVVVDGLAGMSISDISDDDGKGSLLSLIQPIRTPDKSKNPPDANPGNGNNTSNSAKTPDSNNPQTSGLKSESNTGKIIGGVIGSLFGFAILGLFGFIGYRYHKERPKSFSAFIKSFPNRNAYSSSGNHGALRNTEIPPDTTNRGQVNTVIPIASGYVTAMFDFTGKEENDLSFKKGDKIEVLERGDGPNDWWVGRVNGAVGEFPGNYVKET